MGFSFQGIHSKEKKLKARIMGYPMLPAFRNNTESIPGRSGILDFGMEYSERIIPVECSVFPEQDFSALLQSKSSSPKSLCPAKNNLTVKP